MKKLPRSKWGESAIERLLATANADPRVDTIAFLNKRDEQGRPLFNIVSKEVSGEHAGSTIAGRLEESQEERKVRLEKNRYMDAGRKWILNLQRRFFDNEITLKQAKNELQEFKKSVPVAKDGTLWQETFGIAQLERDFDEIERFEKGCKAHKITQYDILQVIHHYETGRHMSEKVRAKADKVGAFFQRFFNTPDGIFDYSGFRDLYKLRW